MKKIVSKEIKNEDENSLSVILEGLPYFMEMASIQE